MSRRILSGYSFTALKTITVLAVSLYLTGFSTAFANHLNEQIDELNQQNYSNQVAQEALQEEAESFDQVIQALQVEIVGLEKQLQDSQKQLRSIEDQIADAKAEIEQYKEVLGASIRQMYIEGDITTLEMLATSRDLSDFLDQEQYRSSIQEQIKISLDAIEELKTELNEKKIETQAIIADQTAMQNRLNTQKSEQDRLLSLNQQQRLDYEQSTRQNTVKIAELQRQQALENAQVFGTTPGTGEDCGGGYPGSAPGPWGNWGCNYPIDNTIDNWGMYNRECVSYTAFKVAASGRKMPYWGGYGNANQWDDNARAANIPVDTNPRVGDVGISNIGTWGHSFYVEQVSGDGSVYVSDYNQQFDGRYREYWISAGTIKAKGFVFIHFL